jgi:hypothetical protein
MKKPDLLVLVAAWDFIAAFWAIMCIAAIALFALPEVMAPYFGRALLGMIFGLSLGMLILLAALSIALTAGIGVLRGKEWGRLLSIINAALSLFWFPVGTVIGLLVIVYLAREEVRQYFLLNAK